MKLHNYTHSIFCVIFLIFLVTIRCNDPIVIDEIDPKLEAHKELASGNQLVSREFLFGEDDKQSSILKIGKTK